MPTIDEMDELVNWDQAADGVDGNFPFDVSAQDLHNDPNFSMDLSFAAVADDNVGFFALQHFSGDLPAADGIDDLAGMTTPNDFGLDFDAALPDDHQWPRECWETPVSPCVECSRNRFQCKRIREGKYKGYCTSCVALGYDCSFACFPMPGMEDAIAPQPSTSWTSQPELSTLATSENPLKLMHSTSATDLPSMTATAPSSADAMAVAMANPGPAKIGARLSRESIRVLKQWLSTHTRHPYPSDEEKEMLQRQTGLTKIQISNWLANARRRGKVQPPRSTSPHVRNLSAGLDIPRRGTPALELMNPLQRWENSPPEHEPASAIAIARAVTASTISSGQASPFSHVYTDDGTGLSLQESSASSVGTSHGTSHSSNKSFASAYSHASRGSLGSFGSFGSLGRSRRRRRRRNAPKKVEDKTPLAPALKTYQCTFCTETFKTKHDWQRHEKSLHLSLERWVCCTGGPKAVKPDINMPACVFCGEPNPSEEHVESHNYSACQEKNLEGRTFYRKDHLNQHLRLVHNVKFADWSMKSWKVATPEIRSRCGFCGIVMDTWSIRVDHLAEHFKTGYSMADWKGDWGFETPVLELVENSIPPYLIHTERQSPLPYVAGVSPPESPRNAYELIKLELDYFMEKNRDFGTLADDQLLLEACRIIFASEVLSLQGISSTVSWLRDLIMSKEAVTQQGRVAPLRSQAENRLAILKINGKDNLFEACPLEAELREFVRAKTLLGLTAMDDELQEEACKIVGKMEEVSTHPSDNVANWLVRMVNSSTSWLASFRQRAHLPRSEDMGDFKRRSKDPKTIDSTVHNYSRLERELGEYLDLQHALGIEPTDDDLQRQARLIIYELEDGWNQTAADNADWLEAFRKRHSQSSRKAGSSTVSSDSNPLPSSIGSASASRKDKPYVYRGPRFSFNDANCYRRLAQELKRFVASTMSPNNPNRRVPSDEELQHQARWILYDDDDPWNQTAADNAEWLRRFKRDVGIIQDGPGLPETDSWSIQQGGSGFAPPYAVPKEGAVEYNGPVQVSCCDGAWTFETNQSVANKFVESLSTRYPKPARIFCSRELEEGLTDFVRQQVTGMGVFPSDQALQTRARDILGTNTTAADDGVLLGKFKDLMESELGVSSTTAFVGAAPPTLAAPIPRHATLVPRTNSGPLTGLGAAITDEDAHRIVQEMNFELEFDQDVMMGGNLSTF